MKRYKKGYLDGLDAARRAVMAAPTATFGRRVATAVGGVPRIEDRAVNPDGNPDVAATTYAMRDAILGWIDRLAEAGVDDK